MTNGLLIYGEIFAHFPIYEEALPHIRLCNCSTLNFLIYEKNFISFFMSVTPTLIYLFSVYECYIMRHIKNIDRNNHNVLLLWN
jgi:hypothetical protein